MRKKILVIDDDEMTLVALAEKLKRKGHWVTTSLDGVEALKIINGGEFDVIICDVFMPSLSGFELLTMLRTFYLCKLPLMLMSGYKDDRIAEISDFLGACTFITKPLDYEELFKKLEDIALGVSKTSK